ncbi:MAG: hypothetical protein A2Y79_04685 [Deltaproteobacteria bacterium RBG_13_43_22]|jgi:hypothetical protein|nr:MAG: hypothetical protein A2Y79_04685 [Deltaproteobacteria bacterium RBG_13_43_22]
MAETYPINIWINEERYAKLQKAGLAELTQDAFAGLKKLPVPNTMNQVDRVVKLFPKAKFDSATTKTIELLPKDVKDDIFDMVVSMGKIDIMEEFLKKHGA